MGEGDDGEGVVGLELLMAALAASWMRLSRLMPVPSSSYMEPLNVEHQGQVQAQRLARPPPLGMSLIRA